MLMDKDGRTARWRPATYRAHIPARPTQQEYEALVEEFWWSSTYVAKALRRGEVFFAQFVLTHDLRDGALRRVLEWRIEIAHDWLLRPGAYGRGLEQLLPDDLWAELAATYVGADVDENWEALFRMGALFRRVATEVADGLEFEYPARVDDGVRRLLTDVRGLE